MSATSNNAIPAIRFESYLRQAGVLVTELDANKSERGKASRIGSYLSPLVDHTVPIQVNGRTGVATLKSTKARSNQTRYHFEIRWDEPLRADPGANATKAITGMQQRPADLGGKESAPPATVSSPHTDKSTPSTRTTKGSVLPKVGPAAPNPHVGHKNATKSPSECDAPAAVLKVGKPDGGRPTGEGNDEEW